MIGSCIYLEDLQSGLITDLRLDSTYTFLIDSTSPSHRFNLNLNLDYNIIVDNPVCFGDSSGSVLINGDSLSGSYFNLFDSSGIIVDSIIATSNSIVFSNLYSGIYFINTNHSSSCSVSNQEIVIATPTEISANFYTLHDTVYLNDFATPIPVVFKNSSVGFDSCYWNFGDGNFSSDVNPIHYYSSPGTYNVILEIQNDSLCTDIFSKELIVFDSLSTHNELEKFNSKIEVYFYENYLHINSELNFINIDIYNMSGKLLKESSLDLIYFGNLPKGLYILKLEDNDGNFYFRKITY